MNLILWLRRKRQERKREQERQARFLADVLPKIQRAKEEQEQWMRERGIWYAGSKEGTEGTERS